MIRVSLMSSEDLGGHLESLKRGLGLIAFMVSGIIAVTVSGQETGHSFTVTMRSSGSTNEKDRLSRAIHAASIAAGYPEDDLFQRFLFLGPSGLRVDLYYPALPKPRTDQMLMIEVLVSSGTDTNRKKGLVVAQVQKLGEAGIDPNDIMVFFLETDRSSGSFGGGRLAAPCLRLITAHGILAEWS